MTELSTHVFELDLTSVCVSTGIVQLPMKMQPYFEDGAIDAMIDGEGVRLEFSGPRRLGGFRSHFAKRGLKANDKVRFELQVIDEQVDEVSAACVKRERNKPAPAPSQSRDDVGDRPSDPAVAASEGAMRAANGTTGTGSWGDHSSSVRAVRRVTIQGTDTQASLYTSPAAVTAPRVTASPASTSPETARVVAWRALDGLSREGEPSDAEAAEFADTTVRAVRRRSPFGSVAPTTTSRDSQPRRTATTNGDQGSAVSSAGGTEDGVGETSPVGLADLVVPPDGAVAPEPPRARLSPSRARIFAGRGPRADHEALGSTDAMEAKSVPTPATSARGPELIEERELVPVARAAARDRTAESHVVMANNEATHPISNGRIEGRTADDWQGAVRDGLDLTNGRPAGLFDSNGRRDASIAEHGVPGSATVSARRATPVVIDDADFGGDFAAAAETDGLVTGPGVRQESVADHVADGVAPTTTSSKVGLADSLEGDLGLVRDLLERPDAPAIVRSDSVAEQLGLSADRSERALERLSEERDRISRIRKGAYMIRRDATKRSAG